jgi:UDP-N-acetylglucosamine 3-dehydrogenase
MCKEIDLKVNVVVVGFGSMGKNHLRVLSNIDRVSILGVIEPDEKISLPPNIKRLTLKSLRDLDLDYAVVCTPTSSHFEVCMQLASMGINILLEKPACFSKEQAIKLRDEIVQKNLIIGIGYVENFNPAVTATKVFLQTGEIGQVLQVSTQREGPDSKRIHDVGVVKDLLCHDVALVYELIQSKYISLKANKLNANEESPFESSVLVLAELESNTLVSHQVNWIAAKKARGVTIYGTRGTIYLDLLNVKVTVVKQVGPSSSSWPYIDLKSGGVSLESRDLNLTMIEPLLLEHQKFLEKFDLRDTSTKEIDSSIEVHRILELVASGNDD